MTDFSPPTSPPLIDQPAVVGDPAPGPGGPRRRVGPWVAAIGVVVAGLLALFFSQDPNDDSAALQLRSSALSSTSTTSSGGDATDTTGPGSGNPDSTAPEPTAPSSTAPDGETSAVSVEGTFLATMPNVGGPTTPEVDPAIGQIAPTISGTDFSGNEITIGPDGRMKAVYFLAHWCPHCQVEVPTIQGLIDAGVQPDDIDIYGVSTAVSPGRGNYPPRAWFEAEGWTSPVIRDDAEASALIAYGAGGFPFVVFLDGDHRVLSRAAGEMPAGLMQQVWEIVAAGS